MEKIRIASVGKINGSAPLQVRRGIFDDNTVEAGMDQAETVDFPFPGRVVLVGNHTLFEKRPQRTDAKKGRKDMVAVNHIVAPTQYPPPDDGDISQIHPGAPPFTVAVQNITFYTFPLQRFDLFLDKDAKNRIVRRRIICSDMKDSHKK